MEQQMFRWGSSNWPAPGPWLPVGFLFFFLFFVAVFWTIFLSELFFNFSFGFDLPDFVDLLDFVELIDLFDVFDDFSVRLLSDPFLDFPGIFNVSFSFFLS